jgi:hypothetical protein
MCDFLYIIFSDIFSSYVHKKLMYNAAELYKAMRKAVSSQIGCTSR